VRDSSRKALNTLLSQDKNRTLKLGINYDIIREESYSLVDVTFTKGLKMLNSSKQTDRNISRAGANPSFKKIELNLSHNHKIKGAVSITLTLISQYANSIMFSAEEFSYGGSYLGKAFDASELNGDHGVAGIIEFGYNAWTSVKQQGSLIPYIYYDVGCVWRKDRTRIPRETAATYGFGVRYNWLKFNTHLGLAWPKNRNIAVPIYFHGNKGPRIMWEATLNW
jgi:hemolysin activation/secretion protein